MEKKAKKIMQGVVISDKMEKTIVVSVQRTYCHPKLNKVVRTAKKYKVHDEHEQAKIGDVVHIALGRPVSKTKYMHLEHIVKG